ncbi:MAG: hypothetical protein GX417_12005 [Clostridiales bacterium]|nr:hypothetical protein [Clostridiales bacterium]
MKKTHIQVSASSAVGRRLHLNTYTYWRINVMKKVLCMLIAVLLLVAVFAGCGGPTKSDPVPTNDNVAPDESAVSKETPAVSEAPKDTSDIDYGANLAESYAAYLEAKNAVIIKITDGLSNNPDAGMAVLSFLGVGMTDLALLPISFFGMGQETMEIGLSMMGATNIQYTENGNNYTVTYSDKENKEFAYSGTYNPAIDALTCTVTVNGAESTYIEYRKAAFGYIGQYYFLNEDGTTSIYMIAVDGEDGIIGISTTPGKPAALTGSEAADFPKTCSEWYSVKGTTITGMTSDGLDLSFEYVPTDSSN